MKALIKSTIDDLNHYLDGNVTEERVLDSLRDLKLALELKAAMKPLIKHLMETFPYNVTFDEDKYLGDIWDYLYHDLKEELVTNIKER